MLKVENYNNKKYSNNNSKPTFKSNPYSAMDFGTKVLDKFIKSQENLSSTRFIQDTATNWAPKAIFSNRKIYQAQDLFKTRQQTGRRRQFFQEALQILQK